MPGAEIRGQKVEKLKSNILGSDGPQGTHYKCETGVNPVPTMRSFTFIPSFNQDERVRRKEVIWPKLNNLVLSGVLEAYHFQDEMASEGSMQMGIGSC